MMSKIARLIACGLSVAFYAMSDPPFFGRGRYRQTRLTTPPYVTSPLRAMVINLVALADPYLAARMTLRALANHSVLDSTGLRTPSTVSYMPAGVTTSRSLFDASNRNFLLQQISVVGCRAKFCLRA